MIEIAALRNTRLACALLTLALATPPAFAVNKDMVQLQTQVQELQTAIARLQQSNDERMGVLKDLVQQSADSVNKMSVAVDALQQQVRAQHDSTNAKLDQFSGQGQTLNDSLDEVKARLNNLEKAMKSVQDQQQSIDAALQNLAPNSAAAPNATGTPTPPDTAFSAPSVAPPPAAGKKGRPLPGVTPDNAPDASSALPSKLVPPDASALYKTALSDYMAARYALATTEFGEVIRSSPNDPLAGNSFYYLGEIDYRAGKYATAIKDYDHVLEQFPNNAKGPISHLHKGQALFETGKREAGISELRALITRFPNSPEAAQARSKLNGMGVPIVPKRPAQ
jgi:TolA-binding protein